jgi:glycosyltransferase 2 family protein
VSLLAIYLLLQQVSLAQLGEVLRQARPLPIVVLVVTVVASVVARAARWQLYFLPERRVPLRPLLGTLSISYMASTFLPFRAGELVRAVLLGQREAIPIALVLGTILLEKLFDFLAVGVMLVLLLVTTPLPAVASVFGTSLATVILLGFGFVVALAIWREPTLRLVGLVEGVVPFGLGRRLGLGRIAAQFATGTDALREPGLWPPMLAWTVVIWVLSVGSVWAGALSVGLAVGPAAMVFTSVVISSGQAVPSSPGYVGVYHGATVLGLTAFGVDTASALGAAVVSHAFTYGTLVVIGLLALWLGGYGVRDLFRTSAASPRGFGGQESEVGVGSGRGASAGGYRASHVRD